MCIRDSFISLLLTAHVEPIAATFKAISSQQRRYWNFCNPSDSLREFVLTRVYSNEKRYEHPITTDRIVLFPVWSV